MPSVARVPSHHRATRIHFARPFSRRLVLGAEHHQPQFRRLWKLKSRGELMAAESNIRGYDKPTHDELVQLIAETIHPGGPRR